MGAPLSKTAVGERKCQNITATENYVLDTVFHIFILLTILSIFFFTVISHTIRRSLQNEISNALTEAVIETDDWGDPDPDLAEEIRDIANFFDIPNEADWNYNHGLENVCIAIVTGLAFCILCIWATMKLSAQKCPPMWHIVYQNLLLFGVIGCIEYLFFEYVAKEYIPIMPSYVQKQLKEELS